MADKPYSEMTDAERAQIRYVQLTMPELRAAVVAHSIRLGKKPRVGAELGFALQISETEVQDPAHVTAAEVAASRPKAGRLWLWFRVTEADRIEGIDLINSQKAAFHEKMSQIATDEKFLARLNEFLAAAIQAPPDSPP